MDFKPKKYAVLTMDVEDWYHTGYLDPARCARDVSILEVVDQFAGTLEEFGARGTFFVLGELLQPKRQQWNQLVKRGHELASHGWSHIPPMQMTPVQFAAELHQCQKAHRDFIAAPLEGYRAALFSMDRARLNQVIEAGFLYDSSSTARGRKSSQIDLAGFTPLRKQTFSQDHFVEFQVGAPGLSAYFINGGGGTRLLPWPLTLHLFKRFMRTEIDYSFYTHPLDFAPTPLPLPPGLSWLKKARLLGGRAAMGARFSRMLQELVAEDYNFVTFAQLRQELLPVVRQRRNL